MQKHVRWVLLVLCVVVAFLAAPAAALAWTDISDAQWRASYGVTEAQVRAIADGVTADTFAPSRNVTRGQFTKMAVTGLIGSTVSPAIPTFLDVPTNHIFYPYVEKAVDAGLVQGIGGNLFGPARNISRQEVATILTRYLSAAELDARGYIRGSTGVHYASLSAWFAAEGTATLTMFQDRASISAAHRTGVAYLAALGIAQGNNGLFSPLASLIRAQGAALIIRVAEAADEFEPDAPPAVTAVSPIAGPAVGGTAVVITGTNFVGTTAVRFGTLNAISFTVNSATQITAVSPGGIAGQTVQVSVTTPAGTSINTSADNYTYQGVPTVTGLNPASGPAPGGTTVVITGTNFIGATAVKFGTAAATSFTVNSATQITAVSPAGALGSVVQVSVTTPAGTSPNISADDFTYQGLPTVTGLNPAVGAIVGGTTVVITGTNFIGTTAVAFGAAAATSFTVNSATQITAVSPAGTLGSVVQVAVTTPAGTSPNTAADDFTYQGAPTVTNLNPTGGPAVGGTTVVITGTNFIGTTAVAFGTAAATSFTVNSATQITAVSPAGTLGSVVQVSVTTPAGSSSNTSADDFTYLITATAPSSIVLARAVTNPVGAVTNVAIPAPGATDSTGAVTGWVAGTASRITFTVSDVSPAVSTITINGAPYTSGADYTITAASPLTIVVTTTETGKTTAVRTFIVSVAASPYATAPSAMVLAKAAAQPVGAVTNVQIPAPAATDVHGAVTGWVATAADRITFTVSDVSPAVSTITINGAPYTSGADYTITAASPLTIVVTTTETGKTTAVRTFIVSVAATVNISAIPGVAAPAVGATPVTVITETSQYTGTVTWLPNHVPFAGPVVYTATISLTAKPGYTLNGVPANFFTVAGATAVSNPANSGVVTAEFPATAAPAVVNLKDILGVTPPVTGATPVTTITATAQYTGTVTWAPPHNPFQAPFTYTATITLTAKPGYTLSGVGTNFFAVAGASSVSNPANSGVVTATFPVTVPPAVINVAAITGVTPPVTSATPVTTITETAQYTGTVTWSPNHNPFQGAVAYTATITLTPKFGFTLAGVAANFFTVAGATATNAANAGVVTAVFPTT